MTLYFFYFFSFVVILSSFLVVFVSNPVHSVLFLIFTFFNAAIIFLIFKAEFLAMTLLIVYVGAVAVLFLFVVMMLNISESVIKEGFLRYFPFGLLLISIFLIELFMIFNSDKIICVTHETHKYYKHDGSGLKSLTVSSNLKLERDAIYKQVMGFNIVKKNCLFKNDENLKIGHIVLTDNQSFEINSENDLKISEKFLIWLNVFAE